MMKTTDEQTVDNTIATLLNILPMLEQEYPYLDASNNVHETFQKRPLPAKVQKTLVDALALNDQPNLFRYWCRVIQNLSANNAPSLFFVTGILGRMCVSHNVDGSEVTYVRECVYTNNFRWFQSLPHFLNDVEAISKEYFAKDPSVVEVVKWFMDTKGLCPHVPLFHTTFKSASFIKATAPESFEEQSVRIGYNFRVAKELFKKFGQFYLANTFSINDTLYKCVQEMHLPTMSRGSSAINEMRNKLDDLLQTKVRDDIDTISGHGINTTLNDVFYNTPERIRGSDDICIKSDRRQRPLSNKLCKDGEQKLWELYNDYESVLVDIEQYVNEHKDGFDRFERQDRIKKKLEQFNGALQDQRNALSIIHDYCKRVPYAKELATIDERFSSVDSVLDAFPNFEELREAVVFHPTNLNVTEMLVQ